jgi:hypothetical protein
MSKIALTAAALLVATATAFAASDHYGSESANQPAANVNGAVTASVQKPAYLRPSGYQTKMMTGPIAIGSGLTESGQGIWGN